MLIDHVTSRALASADVEAARVARRLLDTRGSFHPGDPSGMTLLLVDGVIRCRIPLPFGCLWNRETVELPGIRFPETIMVGAVGLPLPIIVDHDLFDLTMTVSTIERCDGADMLRITVEQPPCFEILLP